MKDGQGWLFRPNGCLEPPEAAPRVPRGNVDWTVIRVALFDWEGSIPRQRSSPESAPSLPRDVDHTWQPNQSLFFHPQTPLPMAMRAARPGSMAIRAA